MSLLMLDLDNTLVDRDAAFQHWLEHALAGWAPADRSAREWCIAFDRDGVRPRLEFLAGIRDRLGLQTPLAALLQDYRRLTLEGLPPLRPGTLQALRELRAGGWRIAIVTNGESPVQEEKVNAVGLAPLLDACVVSEAVELRKPDPRILSLAAARCGSQLPGAWLIGDGEVDVLCASRAGIRSVWLARGRLWARGDVTPTHTADGLLDALGRLAARTDR